MTMEFFETLRLRLASHISPSKSRLETLALLITGIVGARTLNLSHVASERSTTAKPASTYRRLQRFFQHVTPEDDWAACLMMWSLLSGPGNSSMAGRITLMERYISLFGISSIKTLLADRELIGM